MPAKTTAKTRRAATRNAPVPEVKAAARTRRQASPTRAASPRTRKEAGAGQARQPKSATRRPGAAGVGKPAGTAAQSAGRAPKGRAPKPKALEVSYSGKVFRSRLEARWAVFLDLLDVDWDYEPCHYRVAPGLTYLPDFYLPSLRLWLEVKGPSFMNAESMAKCLAAVAGPNPIPAREAPYAAAGRLLLGGPFPGPGLGTPVHTLISAAGASRADLGYVTFGAGGTLAAGPAWDNVPVDGVKKARRPSPARLRLLLEPAPVAGSPEVRVAEAYRIAANLIFDDAGRTVSTANGGALLARLGQRRAGRPLGAAA